jgi:hypothetical protein
MKLKDRLGLNQKAVTPAPAAAPTRTAANGGQ